VKILVVEDDRTVGQYVKRGLEEQRYQADLVDDGMEGLRLASGGRYDIIVLDLRLPGMNGFEMLRTLRDRGNTTPVLVLTAQDSVDFKVQALRAGADDYVTKPFGLDELRARVGALLRRAGGPAATPDGRLVLGTIELDVAAHRVTVRGAPVDLTPREFELLKVMIGSPGRVLTKGRLLRAVWGTAYADEAHYLHVYISRLRRKLQAADPTGVAGRLITAEPGIGYRIGEPTGATDADR
jgi:DNA-binding response OmpR family regulator